MIDLKCEQLNFFLHFLLEYTPQTVKVKGRKNCKTKQFSIANSLMLNIKQSVD